MNLLPCMHLVFQGIATSHVPCRDDHGPTEQQTVATPSDHSAAEALTSTLSTRTTEDVLLSSWDIPGPVVNPTCMTMSIIQIRVVTIYLIIDNSRHSLYH